MTRTSVIIFSRSSIGLLLALMLAACGFSSVLESDVGGRAQTFPASYKSELLAFFRSYLNDPVSVRDAEMAEPVQRTISGKPRFLSCVKLNPRESDGTYRGVRVRGVIYSDGRLDRVLDDLGDLCAGVSYAPFPDLEKMSR